MSRTAARRVPQLRSLPTGAVGVTLVLALGASTAAAGPQYEAYLYYSPNNQYYARVQTTTPPAFSAGSANFYDGTYAYEAEARAGSFHTDVTVTDYGHLQYGLVQAAGAIARFDDVLITDGTGIPKPVAAYVRFDVQGVAGYTFAGGGDGNNVDASGEFNVTFGGYVRSYWAPAGGRFSAPYPSTGAFVGISDSTLSGTFQVGPFSVWTESPQTLQLTTISRVGVSAHQGGWIGGQCEMAASLAHGAPALVLPDGFVANSAQASIVDNWYVGNAVSVAEGGPRRGPVALEQNAPNPFSAHTEIRYSLREAGPVRLGIFDVAGRRVAELVSGEQAAGTHVVHWDGEVAAGRPLAPGVYFYALETDGERIARRMLLIR